MQTLVAPARQASAGAARDDALGHAAIAGLDARDPRSDRLDDAGPLVPERERVAHERGIHEAVAELEVGAAEAAEGRADDDLPGSGHERRALGEREPARLLDDEGAPHAGTACGTARSDETRSACSCTLSPI